MFSLRQGYGLSLPRPPFRPPNLPLKWLKGQGKLGPDLGSSQASPYWASNSVVFSFLFILMFSHSLNISLLCRAGKVPADMLPLPAALWGMHTVCWQQQVLLGFSP